ncbi:carbon-nitrogen hydrolase family protein [Brevibacterium samyangense]|uniref:Carbon-nitrogen hydrolase family protein n=1 Tax=Brevibacterium samyangense TaxID=366888 RepID=A0ABP5F5Y4_9MICO
MTSASAPASTNPAPTNPESAGPLVALAQFSPAADVEANLATITGLTARAAAEGADLVVFPEHAMFTDPDHLTGPYYAHEPLDGPFLTAVRALASEHRIAIVVGLTETTPAELADPRPFNTLVAIGPEGTDLARYRKVHLYDAFGHRESDASRPADDIEAVTFTYRGLTFGLAICYDIRFPEISRRLVDAGAEAIVNPAAWPTGPAKEHHWEALTTARAIENTAYVLACGQTGPHCIGQSRIVDPMGSTLASAAEAPGALALARLDPARVPEVRLTNPSLENRRLRITEPEGASGRV